MSRRSHGQVRRSQVVTTWGPGALLDLPRYAVIVGGLDTWPKPGDLEEISEPRLVRKIRTMTGVDAPRLYAPRPTRTIHGRPRGVSASGAFPSGSSSRSRAAAAKSASAHAASSTGSTSTSAAASTAGRSCRPDSSAPARRGMWTTWIGAASSTAPRTPAAKNSGSTSEAPAATSPSSWCAASAAGRAACTRPPCSRLIRSASAAGRGLGWGAKRARSASSRAAC